MQYLPFIHSLAIEKKSGSLGTRIMNSQLTCLQVPVSGFFVIVAVNLWTGTKSRGTEGAG